MNNEQPRSNSPLIFAGLFVAVCLIGALVYYLVTLPRPHAGQLAISLYVLPTDAKLTLDGQAASPGTVYLSPGMHTVAASKPGWKDQSKSFKVEPDLPQTATVGLLPDSAEATAYVNKHQDLYAQAEQRGGRESASATQTFEEHNPIVPHLNYENYLYTIGYELDPTDPTNQSIILTIDASTGYRNAAVEQVRALGFNPTDFKYDFSDYKDPFSS